MPISKQTLMTRLLPQGVNEFDTEEIAKAIQQKMELLSNEERATGTANLKVFLDELMGDLIPKLRESISQAIVDELHTNALVAGKAAVGGSVTPAGVITGVATMTEGKIL